VRVILYNIAFLLDIIFYTLESMQYTNLFIDLSAKLQMCCTE
jgi:hypothetical protein